MSPDKTIYIDDGFEKLLRTLKDAPQKVLPYLRKAMILSVRAVQGRVSEYPEATEANRPGRVDKEGRPVGYYERGRGWWYPVMRSESLSGKLRVAAGVQTAKQAAKRFKVKHIPSVAGYKLRCGGESEMLGRSWDAQVIEGEGAIVGIVGNNASYAEVVQGDLQAQFHAERDWTTDQKALEESEPEIMGFFDQALADYLEKEILDTE